MYNSKKILNSVLKAAKNLMLLDSPFYSFYLLNINKIITTDIDTMGVGISNFDYILYINPYFWEALTENQKIGLLKHEILHMVFEHPLNLRRFTNPKKANIAADLEINSYIDSRYLPVLKDLPEIKREDYNTIDEYYKALYANGAPKGCYVEDYNYDPKLGTTKYYNLLEENDGQSNNSQEGSQGGNNPYDSSHDKYSNNISKEAANLLKKVNEGRLKEIAKSLNNNSKLMGSLPARLQEQLELLLKPQKEVVDWKHVLRSIVGLSNSYEVGFTRKKKNFRFPDMPVSFLKRKKQIMFAIDTSGSMSDNDLQEGFSEMMNIHKKGAIVQVIEADADIEAIYDIDKKELAKKNSVSGRGGTSFDPVLKHFNKQKDSLLIYFTDGYAPKPKVVLKGDKKVLWIITSNGRNINDMQDFPGIIVKMVKQNGI